MGQQTFSVWSQIVNVLGYASQEAKSRLVCRYLCNEKTNFHRFFFDKIQNTMIIIEYNLSEIQVS